MLQQLLEESEKAGLTMNISKTKAMTNSRQVTLYVRSLAIEYVDEYIYLGQIISPTQQMYKEVDRRITSSWSRYWSLKYVFKNKSLPMSVKRRLFNTIILPIMTYGCQTWSQTKQNIKRIKVCQQSMERSMLQIKLKDKWKLTKIRQFTKLEDASSRIKRLKWKWTGHMMRSTKDKWTRDITEWYPRDGTRNRGRQIKRWEDDLPKGWRRSAQDRKKWRSMEEAYVKGQPDQ